MVNDLKFYEIDPMTLGDDTEAEVEIQGDEAEA